MEPDAEAIELDVEDYENFMVLLAECLGRTSGHGLPELLRDMVDRRPAPPWLDGGDRSRTARLKHMIASLNKAATEARERP